MNAVNNVAWGTRYLVRRVQRVEAALKDCLKDATSQLMWQKITGDSSGTCEGTLGTAVATYLFVGTMKLNERSWFQNGSLGDRLSVPERRNRYSLLESWFSWLLVAPIISHTMNWQQCQRITHLLLGKYSLLESWFSWLLVAPIISHTMNWQHCQRITHLLLGKYSLLESWFSWLLVAPIISHTMNWQVCDNTVNVSHIYC